MKKLIVTLLAGFTVLLAQAAESDWMTDLPKALTKAKAENKQVLLDFTGSDWCPPCKALHKNVLSNQTFLDYAKSNLVLVVVDFPRSKEQSAELKTANRALSKKYSIEGYPTVIVLDSTGKQLKKDVGYSGQSASAFVTDLKKLKK
jgi:protein disulfide-isomerase